MDSMNSKPVEKEKIRAEANPAATESDPAQSPWKLLLLLGVAGLAASVSFNFLLFQQNSMLKQQFARQTEQSRRLEQTKNACQSLIQDIVNFSNQHPDVLEILARHGAIKFVSAPSEPPPIPPPPSAKP